MSDVPPEVAEAAKVGAGGGLGLAMMVLWQKLFTKDERLEKVLDRLDAMARELEAVRTSLAVLVAASARRDDEFDALRARHLRLRRYAARHVVR